MITCGVDAGGECLKIVLFDDNQILSYSSTLYGRNSVIETAQVGLDEALAKAKVSRSVISYIMAAGNNRDIITFAQGHASEPICCARGANWLLPSTRTVIDLGVDKSIVLQCDSGSVLRIARNDTCAAGTSRYLKVISDLLRVTEEEAGQLSLQSNETVNIEATCTVFVESEIISLIHQGRSREDILKGVFKGMAQRIYPLLLRVGLKKDVTLVGGIAKNIGIIKALEEQIGFSVIIPEEPIIMEALGAAILARENGEGADRAT